MKIILNNLDSYEMKMPERVTVKQLNKVIIKLQTIAKLEDEVIIKSEVSAISQKFKFKVSKSKITKKPKKNFENSERLKIRKLSRKDIIEGMQVMHYGTKNDRKNYCKRKGIINFAILRSRFTQFKKSFKITPKEVGLTRFAKVGESTDKRKKLLKPNFKPLFKK